MTNHIKRMNSLLCHRGILLLQSKCTKYNTLVDPFEDYYDSDFHASSGIYDENCHDLIDICLGPVNFYSEEIWEDIEEMVRVVRGLKGIFEPQIPLNFAADALNSITRESIQELQQASIIYFYNFIMLVSLSQINDFSFKLF